MAKCCLLRVEKREALAAFIKNNAGLTLIDVAVLLVIISLLLFPALKLLDVSRENKRTTALYGVPADLARALNDYALRNGLYPVPADPSLPITNANVFRSVPTVPAAAACANPSSQGITFTGTASPNGVLCRPQRPTNVAAASQVLIGALPVTSMGLPVKAGFDQYGRKYMYILTRVMATSPSGVPYMNTVANNDNGSVVIVDQAGTSITNSAHFAIFTLGRNGAGGFLPNGTIMADNTCGTGLDEYNRWACRGGATHHAGVVMDFRTLDTMGIITKSTVSLTQNANYFDDASAFSTSMLGKIWTPRAMTEEYFTLGNVSSTGKIGVDYLDTTTDAPTNTLTMQTGNIKASGNMETARICNDNPSPPTSGGIVSANSCFLPDNIVDTSLYCSDTGPILRVSQNSGAPSNAVRTCDSTVKAMAVQDCGGSLAYRTVNISGTPTCF